MGCPDRRRVVAVVNNEKPLLEVLTITLEEEGYEVRAFDNTGDAL
jgi:DNA-binding response OmpR family regulator